MNELAYLFTASFSDQIKEIPAPDSDTVIIYPPTINWDWMKQRPQQIMEQFSQHGYQVYYCNMTQKKEDLFTPLSDNLTLIHNNSYFVNKTIPYLKMLGKKIIVWCSWSKLYPLLDYYEPDFIIYDYLDDMPAWELYLQGMVEKADVVVTTAHKLHSQIETAYPDKNSYFIPNGCALDHFQRIHPVPIEFQNHAGPIILYSGAWANWIDTDLVETIANTFPKAMFAIVGAEFNAEINRSIPNICYVGHQCYEALASYICHSTVCIVPFLINSITIAANPIKVYEYLAAGKPVVSTDLPEVQDMPGVHIAATHEQFLEHLELILNNQSTFPRKKVSQWLNMQTWEYRFKQIQAMLDDSHITK